METGERVRERRVALGWSQNELAGEAGMHASEVSDIETGRRTNLSSARLTALADALDCSTDWLLGRSGAKAPNPRKPARRGPRKP